MNHLIVLISGKQGSGKTSLAIGLRERIMSAPLMRVRTFAFADPLYEMHDKVLSVCQRYGLETKRKYGPLLQYLGTEFGRAEFGPNVWVDLAKYSIKVDVDRQNELNRISGGKCRSVYIISDCRFQNEVTQFPEALKIRLDCPAEIRKKRILSTPGQNWRENQNHPSEIDLDFFEGWDRIIDTSEVSAKDCLELVYGDILRRLGTLGDPNASETSSSP